MSSYSNNTECEKCGYSGATERSENNYIVYYCPLCGWQDFNGDPSSYYYDESGKYNPTKNEIERAERYVKYLDASELDSSAVYEYDLINYRNNEAKFMKELLKIVFIGE